MPIDSDALSHSSVEAWAWQRLQTEGLSEPLRDALTRIVDVLEQERLREHDCFLSVVLRTQAKRWEQLKDALVCLAGQTDQDFEVLIMLHDVSPEDEARVGGLVASYPSDFADRVRLHPVRGGGRARPLAVGVELARGEYVAFFDDDDLLMANWVEAFHEAAIANRGKMIRTNVAVQRNRPEEWSEGRIGQRSISRATPEYATHFNMLEHLETNRTPFMGYAFPRSVFSFWGERFDETLPVLEDWDIALRGAGVVGVSSSDELTAIYRHWEEAQTSYTSHDEEEWEAAADRVRTRLLGAPLLLHENMYEDLLETLEEERRLRKEMSESTFWRLTWPFRRLVARARAVRARLRR